MAVRIWTFWTISTKTYDLLSTKTYDRLSTETELIHYRIPEKSQKNRLSTTRNSILLLVRFLSVRDLVSLSRSIVLTSGTGRAFGICVFDSFGYGLGSLGDLAIPRSGSLWGRASPSPD